MNRYTPFSTFQAGNDAQITVGRHGKLCLYNKNTQQKLYVRLSQYKRAVITSAESLYNDTAHKAVIKFEAETAEFSIRRELTLYLDSGIAECADTIRNLSKQEISFRPGCLFEAYVQKQEGTRVAMLTGGGNFTGSHILRDETPPDGQQNEYRSNEKARVIRVDGIKKSKRKFVEGTAVWQEFFAFQGRTGGFHITFDYAGIWSACIKNQEKRFSVETSLPKERVVLASDESLRLPTVRFGAYTGDLDALGNSILNFCYQHKWDRTNPDYFGKTNAFMFWINDTHTSMPQCENAFWIVRNAQAIGAELIHIDDFWYDRKGDWNSIAPDDFAALNSYARHCGLRLSVWYAPWHADHGSAPFKAHPEWRVRNDHKQWYGGHFDLSNGQACAWQQQLMDCKQNEWGPHMMKYDGEPIWPSGGTLSLMPKASANWYRLIDEFRARHPDAGIFGCASGGELMGIEALRLSDLHCVTDGLAGHYNGYYNSLITPPDKIMGGGRNIWGQPYDLTSRGEWRTEVQINMNNATAAASPIDVEALRKDVERYRYFHFKGCAGRWAQVYRPLCKEADPSFLLQKMSVDLMCGYITVDTSLCPRDMTMTIYPKGLLEDQLYTLRAIEGSFASSCRTGQEWMQGGIEIASMHPGELICINLEDMPGIFHHSLLVPDPMECTAKAETIMGHAGVGISWKRPPMAQWYSYAQIICEEQPVAIASTGEYCFLPDADPKRRYAVLFVDGYGNHSNIISCC